MASRERESTTIGALLAKHGGSVKTGPFGTALKAKEYSKDGVHLISVGEIGYGTFRISDSTPRVPKEVVERLPEYLLQINDIVFGRKGGVDRSAIVKAEQAGWFLGSDGIRLRLPNTCDASFIAYQLQSLSSRDWIIQHATGTTMASLNQEVIGRIPIVLPPIDEQRRIAHILGALDDKIKLNRQLNATLEQLARSLFQSWFVDFDPVRAKASGEPEESICRRLGLTSKLLALFPVAFESSAMGNIPAGWKVTSIGEAVDVVGGGTPSTAIEEYWQKGTYHWATPKDLSGLNSPMLLDTDRKITEKGVRNISSGLLPRDTVLLSSRAPVGYLAISAVPIAINQGFIALRCNGPITPYYAYMWCLDNMEAIKSRASGTTFLEISKKSFRPMPVLIPDKQIMLEFTALVELLFNQIEEGAKEAVTLANLRDELLPKLLSGQIKLS